MPYTIRDLQLSTVSSIRLLCILGTVPTPKRRETKRLKKIAQLVSPHSQSIHISTKPIPVVYYVVDCGVLRAEESYAFHGKGRACNERMNTNCHAADLSATCDSFHDSMQTLKTLLHSPENTSHSVNGLARRSTSTPTSHPDSNQTLEDGRLLQALRVLQSRLATAECIPNELRRQLEREQSRYLVLMQEFRCLEDTLAQEKAQRLHLEKSHDAAMQLLESRLVEVEQERLTVFEDSKRVQEKLRQVEDELQNERSVRQDKEKEFAEQIKNKTMEVHVVKETKDKEIEELVLSMRKEIEEMTKSKKNEIEALKESKQSEILVLTNSKQNEIEELLNCKEEEFEMLTQSKQKEIEEMSLAKEVEIESLKKANEKELNTKEKELKELKRQITLQSMNQEPKIQTPPQPKIKPTGSLFYPATPDQKIASSDLGITNTTVSSPFNVPMLQEKIMRLQRELEQEQLLREKEHFKHLQEMDNILQQKQSAMSQRDSLAAKLTGIEKIQQMMQMQLEAAQTKNISKIEVIDVARFQCKDGRQEDEMEIL